MTGLYLMLILICTEPHPPECVSPNPDEMMRSPVCIAVSKTCTLHQDWVRGDWKDCHKRAAKLLTAERQKGYRRASRPECFLREDQP